MLVQDYLRKKAIIGTDSRVDFLIEKKPHKICKRLDGLNRHWFRGLKYKSLRW